MYHYSNQKDENKLRNTFLFTALISFLPFLLIGLIGYTDWADIITWDYRIGAFFYDLRTPGRTEIAIAVTRLADRSGQTITTVLIAALLLAFKKWRTAIWYGLTVLLGSDYLNDFTKNIFQRMRPDQIDHLIEQGEYAYPSGHAMGSMIIYGGLLFILIRYFNTQKRNWTAQKGLLVFLISLIVLAIGLSRIYLGVHYPSDVIGGYSLGLAWLSLSIAVFGLPFTKKEFQIRKGYRFKRL